MTLAEFYINMKDTAETDGANGIISIQAAQKIVADAEERLMALTVEQASSLVR